MNAKALIVPAAGGAAALIAAALFLLPAAAADTSAANGGATAQPAPVDEGPAGMPADCPMWDDSESAAAAGMYEQCRSIMSDSGMGHMMGMMGMMGMMRMMGAGGMHMDGSCGMAEQAAGTDAATWCPLAGAEPDASQAVMGACHAAETDD